jgi:succinate dehydrogenase / fumarate reductase cytochrome b subunit
MPRRDLIVYPRKQIYTLHPGTVAWLLHRITGVLLGFYIILHILGASSILPWFHRAIDLPPIRFTIFIVFLYHALNGFRIILVDFFNGAEKEVFFKQYMAVIFLFVILAILGAIPIFI